MDRRHTIGNEGSGVGKGLAVLPGAVGSPDHREPDHVSIVREDDGVYREDVGVERQKSPRLGFVSKIWGKSRVACKGDLLSRLL